MLLCYVMYVMSSTNLLPCYRGFTSRTIVDKLSCYWGLIPIPLGKHSHAVLGCLEL